MKVIKYKMDALMEENNKLKEENKRLKEDNNRMCIENARLNKLLENYINSRKAYYEKNKEIVNQKAKARMKKLAEENPEKLREKNRLAYLKRKEKLKMLNHNNDTN